MQIVGFLVLAGQLARVQRQEFGWPEFMRRSWAWTASRLRRLLRRPVHAQVHSVLPAMTAEAAGRLSVRKGMGPGAADRFSAIEFNLEQIEKEFGQKIDAVNASVEGLRQELTMSRHAIEQRELEREVQRRIELQSSIAWEGWAIALFVVGTSLAVWGSVSTC